MKHRRRQQARAWILRFTLLYHLTPKELERFLRWIVRNGNVFLDELEQYPDLERVNLEGIDDILRAAGIFSPQKVKPPHPLISPRWFPRDLPPSRLIGGWMQSVRKVGFALSSVVLFLSGSAAIEQLQPRVLTTDVGEQHTYILPDGTEVVLNTDSRVLIDYRAHKRRLKLEKGEARFIVARGNRPFSVDTASASIRDIGTTFNVYVSGQGTNVAVLQGRVLVSAARSPEKPLTLDAGQQGAVTSAGKLLPGGTRPLARAEQWPRHQMMFNEELATEIVAEVARYYKQKIQIDPGLAQERLTTVLPLDDFATLGRLLDADPRIEVTIGSDGTLLLREQQP
jgi:ferric-dicitrate binding protein FerR (iron transport regulator)